MRTKLLIRLWPLGLAGVLAAGSSPLAYGADPAAVSSTEPPLTEVVVTAERKQEALQDVPMSLTAINTETLTLTGETRLQDYFDTVPGLNFTTDQSGQAAISIRGITTGQGAGNPTVAIAIDDAPFGSSSTYGGGGVQFFPDLDPSDLARIEVLRGPQGTLYGASALGGLVKLVTVDPSTDSVFGRLEVSGTDTQNAPNAGYVVRGAANIPLGDTLATRVSSFYRNDPGYIDDALTGEKGVNKSTSAGAHWALLWRPSDSLSVKMSAIYQDDKRYGSPLSETLLADLTQYFLPNTGTLDKKAQAYSINVHAKLGSVDLTSVSAYSLARFDEWDDWSQNPVFPPISEGANNVAGFLNHFLQRTDKYTQEVRLSSSVGRLDWLLGGFYTYEYSHSTQRWYSANAVPPFGIVGAALLDSGWPTSYEDLAGFLNLTYHFTDQFDLQAGARETRNRQTYSEVDGGAFYGGSPAIQPETDTKDNSFTYLVSPRYKISPDLMLYGRVASGYRAGGPNTDCALYNDPCHFNPDTTTNYEIGVKGDTLNHRLTFDAALYYIDWKDIQLEYNPNGALASAYGNAGNAKSEGLELAVSVRPVTGLTIDSWVAFNEAVVTENSTASSAITYVSGQRLPDSSRWSGNLAIQQEFPIANEWRGFVGASVSYLSDRSEGVAPNPCGAQGSVPCMYPFFPPYAKVNFNAGARYLSWSASLYVDNLTNKRGTLSGSAGPYFFYPNYYDYIRPRTVGLRFVKEFE